MYRARCNQVPRQAREAAAVGLFYQLEVVNGRSETEFGTEGTGTRGEFVLMMFRLASDEVNAKLAALEEVPPLSEDMAAELPSSMQTWETGVSNGEGEAMSMADIFAAGMALGSGAGADILGGIYNQVTGGSEGDKTRREFAKDVRLQNQLRLEGLTEAAPVLDQIAKMQDARFIVGCIDLQFCK